MASPFYLAELIAAARSAAGAAKSWVATDDSADTVDCEEAASWRENAR